MKYTSEFEISRRDGVERVGRQAETASRRSSGYCYTIFFQNQTSGTAWYVHISRRDGIEFQWLSGVFLGFPPPLWVFPPCFAPPAAEGGRKFLVVFFAKANRKFWEIWPFLGFPPCFAPPNNKGGEPRNTPDNVFFNKNLRDRLSAPPQKSELGEWQSVRNDRRIIPARRGTFPRHEGSSLSILPI